MIVSKRAESAVPLHPILGDRWSGRAFTPAPVAGHDRIALLEAARWAPSSRNEQPWRLVAIATGDATRAAVDAALTPGNQWAREAPLLVVVAAARHLELDGAANRYAWHDAGVATGQLLAEATARGLATHVMGGFDAAALRAAVALPEGIDPVTVIAIGRRAPADTLSEPLRTRELAPRMRRPLETIAFHGRYGIPIEPQEPAEPARGAP